MKEITRIEKVYDFNELSESAKDNAKCRYLENFREPYIFTEICEEQLREIFPKSNLNVQYSLSYCQGDGLNVYGIFALSDIISFIKNRYQHYNEKFTKKEKRFIDFLEKQNCISIKTNENNHYCYYTDKAEDVRYYIEYEMENDYFRDIPYSTIQVISEVFDDCFGNYCKGLEEEGYNYFYEVDEEEINDMWEANEYLGWTEEGEPVYQ